ncbi:unnamed protein product, partial [Scytosiphon promiscuus]
SHFIAETPQTKRVGAEAMGKMKKTTARIFSLLFFGVLALCGASASKKATDTKVQNLGHKITGLERQLQTDGNMCSNGLPGYEASKVCCPLSCGTCGGPGCSKLGDGCCTSDVKDSGELCSDTKAAPCIIDDDDDDVVVDDNTCSNGLSGYEASKVCCPLSCGTCGGPGCSKLGDGCCTSDVKDSGALCSETQAAPCYIDDDDVVVDDNTCSNGLPGYEASKVCCPLSCGTCGGPGCSKLGDGCCTSDVKDSGALCSETQAAPCYIDDDDDDDVVIDGNTCSNGLPGYEASKVCCPLSCGTCGGPGCSKLGDGCCTSDVKDSGALCSETKAAPCIIGDGVIDDPMCSNGLPGYEASKVCCPLSCGTCGGPGCSKLGDGCCTS